MPYKPWTIKENGKSENADKENLAERVNDFMSSESPGLCESEADCEQLRARFWKAMAAATLVKDKKGGDKKLAKVSAMISAYVCDVPSHLLISLTM